MAANLTYVKGVRTRFRNVLTTEVNTAKELLSHEIDELDDEDLEIAKVTKCLEKLKSYSERVEIQGEKLAFSLTGETNETEETTTILDEDGALCSESMELYLDLKQYKCKLLSEKEKDAESVLLEESNTKQLLDLQSNMQDLLSAQMRQQERRDKKEAERESSVKLPKIEIISFNGDKTKWAEFWDSFECAVHNNKKLSGIEKFSYLRSKLFGEARSSISGLSLSNENYKVAIEILQTRFANSQEIVDRHYNELINLKAANNDVNSLRSLLDKVLRHLRSLEVLKQNVDQDVFVSILRSKLPEDVLVQLEINKGVDKKWTVKTLGEKLHQYVVARERATKETKKTSHRNGQTVQESVRSTSYKANMNRNRTSPYNSSAQALVSTDVKQRWSKRNDAPITKKCRYCAKDHWSDECTQYKTVTERKNRIKDSCWKCLKSNHSFKECKTNKACVYCGQTNMHHRSLCTKKFQLKQTMTHVVTEAEKQESTTEESGLLSMNETVLMQTALTEIRDAEKTETAPVRLLFDSGSHRSYITEELAGRLNLKEEGEEEISVVTFGSKVSKPIKTKYTKIEVKLTNGNYVEMAVNVVPLISGHLQRRAVNDLKAESIQDILQSVQLADEIPIETEISPVELLVGNDYYLDFVNGEKIELQKGLYLLSSKLGWILSGRTSEPRDESNEQSMLILTRASTLNKSSVFSAIDASQPTKIELEDFWKVESIGILDKETKSDDMLALERFRDTLRFEDNRYYVTWPWKEDEPDLPTNKELALGRLKTTVNRMKNKPEIMKKYDDVISDQLEKGVIEKVEANKSDGIVHYIPHHAVITPQKSTTKLRVVYDASAKTRKENNSLNECLYRGPVMLHDLAGMLMRFRMHTVAMVADIEKAFLQIGLQKNERDVTRFMWLKNITDPTLNCENIQEYRFCRIPFGVISSPFLLGATIEHHLDSYNSEIAERIKRDIYVDNVITGANSVREAKVMYTEAKRIFNEGSMNLREWISSDTEVNETFKQSDRAKIESMKVLGHEWDVAGDTISFRKIATSDTERVSKRVVLKRMASTFDPLGLVCPVLLGCKVFIQDLWKNQLGWDEPLSEKDQLRWQSLADNIDKVSNCSVPRCITHGQIESVENRLLCFCDASQKAYAAAIYLHQTSEQGTFCNLVFAKTRLAPIKTISIPRLELLAVVIGLRCLQFVKEQLQQEIVSSYLWTDSQCVLKWIHSKKPLSVFVKNRVKEINGYTDVSMAFVPTKENPADIASRGTSTKKLKTCESWWKGPHWGSQTCSNWPKFDCELSDPQTQASFESEVCKPKTKETVLPQLQQPDNKMDSETQIKNTPFDIDSKRFSSITKLLRVTVLAKRFVQKMKKKQCKSGYITNVEMEEAEQMWLRYTQWHSYKDVFDAINTNKRNGIQQQLGLFIDQKGILRCKGRMENADLSESARNPILLPKKDRITHLIIEKKHKELLHSGVSQTLSQVRLRYWIPQGRSTVKTIIRSCTVCRRFEGGSYTMPPMCPFPKSKVTKSIPFTRIGLDYLGPLYVKTNDGQTKVWICLFTCLVTRALHLEIVCDMSTAEFLLCFRRFIAQRGTPKEIISDNAMQFKTANAVLSRIWSQIQRCEDIMSYVSNAGITWSFNVELAPWMGGFYERLVGLVKRSLRKTIGRKVLTLIQMQTLVKEVESVINSRPLVYVGDDVNSNIPLSPAHFLTLNPKIGIPNMEISNDKDYLPTESTAERLIDTWKKGQRLLDVFWKLWKNEYLTSLRERTQTHLKTGRVHSQFQPKLNDVVLVKDDTARGCWKFGKLNKLLKSKDGLVRSAKIKTSSGKVVGRPLNLLYPLEVSVDNDSGHT